MDVNGDFWQLEIDDFKIVRTPVCHLSNHPAQNLS